MPDTTPSTLSHESIASLAATQVAVGQKLRSQRNWLLGMLACNLVLVLAALWQAFRDDPSELARDVARTEAGRVAQAEATTALAAQGSYVQAAFRSVQDRAAEALRDVGALAASVDGVRKQMAEATVALAAASSRAAELEARIRSLEARRQELQQETSALASMSRTCADDLAMLTGSVAALRDSETGQLAQHARTLAHVIEEHGSLADVQVLAAAVRTGTFARLECHELVVRRADGSALAELRDDAFTFRDRQANELCRVSTRDDRVTIRVGADGGGPQCTIGPERIAFSRARERSGDRVDAAALGVGKSEGMLVLADVAAAMSPDMLPRRCAMDSRQLLFHDAGAPIVRVGREAEGHGGVRVMGPGSVPGQQRGAMLTPSAMESWEKETGARRTAIQTGDQLYLGLGDGFLRRRSDGSVDSATATQLDGDLSPCLVTLRGR
jgi:hypothetical protein